MTIQKIASFNNIYFEDKQIIKNENLTLENGTKAPKFEGSLIEEKEFRDNKVLFFKNN